MREVGEALDLGLGEKQPAVLVGEACAPSSALADYRSLSVMGLQRLFQESAGITPG